MSSSPEPEWMDASEQPAAEDLRARDHRDLADTDLIPIPLKINQSGRRAGSIAAAAKVFPIFTHPNSQITSASHRRSSSLTSHTQLDLSQRDAAVLTSPWSRRHTFLNVRKHRRNNTSDTISPDESNLLDSFAMATVVSPPHRQISRGNAMMARLDPHWETTSHIQSPPSQSSHQPAQHGELVPASIISPVPAARVNGRQRVGTTDKTLPSKATGVGELDQFTGLRRQPSFKYRFLNMMTSGLNRAQIGQINEENEQNGQRSSQPTGVELPRRSISNANSDKTDLNTALAAFPTPPISALTSPITVRSSRSADSDTQINSCLTMPSRDVTLGAELRIIPEHDHHQGPNQSLLVAIDVKAVTSDPFEEHLTSHMNGLNVAVVIDNSLCNSPSTLMASCEITRLLASLMNRETDQIAVLCTSCADSSNSASGPVVISPLNATKGYKLKSDLDHVASSIAQPDKDGIAKCVRQARQILMKSGPASFSDIHNTYGHVLILTGNENGLRGASFSRDIIQTHVLCHTLAPHRLDELNVNGWKMYSMTMDLPEVKASKKDTNPYNLSSTLRAFLKHARRGKLADCLTNLVLDVQPGPHCKIEKIMGWSKYSKLQLGEVKTVLVKLNVESEPSTPTYDLTSLSSFDLSKVGDSLTNDINTMLGLHSEEVLTARLTFKHSSLPKSTTCTTTERCHLNTRLPTYNTKQLSREVPPTRRKMLVHQLLANYYAASRKPRDAIAALIQQFGADGSRSACPVHIASVVNELKYQARLAERLAIMSSPQKKPTQTFEDPHPGTRVEHFGSKLSDIENYKPQNWIDVSDDDEVDFTTTANTTPTISPVAGTQLMAEELGLDDDDARKIWNDLRNLSKGDDNGGSRRKGKAPLQNTTTAVAQQQQQERAKKITVMALRNKRSIGVSTVRSFTTPVPMPRGVGGAGGTWM